MDAWCGEASSSSVLVSLLSLWGEAKPDRAVEVTGEWSQIRLPARPEQHRPFIKGKVNFAGYIF